MKRILCLILVLSSLFAFTSCAEKTSYDKKIEVKEMREIAELATVDCYFHNVAKSDKPLNPAWFEVWAKKNMRFWVEYEGVVTIGIDANKLKVDVNGTNVKITLPEAIVLDTYVDDESLKEESFYFDPATKKPNANEQSEAYRQAQETMKKSAEQNHSLMANAQDNAKQLLENYVKTIAEAIGVDYKIEWEYLSDNSSTEKAEATESQK